MEEKNKICSKEAVEYFNGDELAATVWQSKYALKDREDNVYETTPADMHRRLAKEFARIEAKYPNGRSEQEIYDAIDHFRYIIPQGSPMSGIGNNFSIQSLSNCFVIESPHDSYGGIMRADEELLQIEKRRGGCIEENTNVIIKGKGYVKIKDVKVGDEILAFDINTRKDTWRKVKDVYVTEVKLEDQVVLKYENGAILETSKKHPVLKLSDNGYEFKTVESGELDNSWNKTFNDCVLDKYIDDLIKLTKEEKEYFVSNDNVKCMLCYSDTTRFEKSIKDIDKNDNCMSVFSIECIHKYGLISEEQYNEICSRVQIESIDTDNEVKKVYYDISVEIDNNYYAGKHGFVNIHNCGVDLSNLRPSNAAVSNAAKTSSGMASFMERYSNSTREVAQNNRRGALMLSLSVKHPDVDKFIDAKLEQGKVTGANISVRLTDEFMRAVVKGDKFIQQWPVDSDNPEIVKEIDARELWNKIVKNAHDSAEPGILFWDTIIRESIADCYSVSGYKSVTCNPCQPSYSIVLTPRGIKQFKNINVGDMVWSSEGWTTIIAKRSSGVKPVYKYTTHSGIFIGTEYHRIMQNGVKIEVKDAEKIDVLAGHKDIRPLDFNDKNIKQAIMDGLVLGDGRFHDAGNTIFLCVGKNDYDYFNSEINDYIIKPYSNQYKVLTTITKNELPKTYNRSVPDRYFYADSYTVRAFLRGLFSANGSVVRQRITYKTSSPKMRDQIMAMLSSVGIRSYYTTNAPHDVEFRNGVYTCKESYDINISTDRQLFFENIGFIQKYKMDKLKRIIDNIKCPQKNVKSSDIFKVEYLGDEEVFNITVDNISHTYWTDGLNVSNCSELTLSPYDSCRLLSLNLYSFVDNPFTKDAYFNMDLFKKHIHLAARMMDDLIDLELEKVEKIISKVEGDKEPEDIKYVELNLWKKIKEATSKARRTGLGITAEGDMLAAMGLRYASDEAIEFSENVHKTIAIEAYRESAVMAKERGTFAVYDKEKEKDNPFLNRLFDADSSLKDIVLANGRRNIGMLTIAPTGTTSLMSQTTSGIEPAFLIVYKRRRKVNPNDPNVNIAYKDEVGDCFEEYYVFHHNFLTWCKVNGYDVDKVKNMPIEEINELVKKSPYYKSTSADIDWVAKVKMQGAIQKWVDHSISVTVNLPKDTPVEVVDKVYMTAWECGCKGMTIYVDGSRSGVLISTENKVENKSLVKPTKRPASLEADVVRFRNNSESWIAFIGKMDGKPYEVFTGVVSDDTINIPKYVESGWIVKSKDKDGKSVYNFEYTNKYGYPQVIGGISYMFNKEYWNYARFISGILRNGIPIVDVLNIINSLSLEEDTINTWKNGVSRALKRYIPDGTKDETGKKCSQCGSDSLVYQEGCLVCTNCGYSKCG